MEINQIDTMWVMLSSAFVMLMIPGLSFFYGGLIRRKNVLSTILHSFVLLLVISIIWFLFGYSLAFSPNGNSFIGDLYFACFKHVTSKPSPLYASTIPHQLFAIFQMMFACITPALISGSFAERKKFISFITFSSLWLVCVYCPIAHWVWSDNGWLANLGALDFAGGSVVHISSGVSAIVCAFVLGNRLDFKKSNIEPHNIPLTMIGVALLWFGWFGFNAGSALSVNSIAVIAFINTHISAASGGCMWLLLSVIVNRNIKATGIGNGVVAGLVAITPAAGFVDMMSSIIIGCVGSGLCYMFVEHFIRKHIDDSIDVFGIHGIGGIVGAILTGVFASFSINSNGSDGLIYGNINLVLIQLFSISVVFVYAGLMSFVLLYIVNFVFGLRVSGIEEDGGLDVTTHHEQGYR